MKYAQKKKTIRKKPILFIGIVLLVIAVGSLLFYLKNHNRPAKTATVSQSEDEKIDLSPPTEAEKQQVQDNKINDTRTPSPTPGTTPPPASDKSVKISQARFDSASQKLVVQTQLYGTGWLQCTLEVNLGAQKITKTADTLYQPDFSTCLGFSVNSSEFPSGGEWNVSVSVANKDGKAYSSNQEKVNITK